MVGSNRASVHRHCKHHIRTQGKARRKPTCSWKGLTSAKRCGRRTSCRHICLNNGLTNIWGTTSRICDWNILIGVRHKALCHRSIGTATAKCYPSHGIFIRHYGSLKYNTVAGLFKGMERLHSATTQRRFWPIQIAVGIICISLSIWIVFSPQIGSYALFFLAGTGLIILGAERIVTGIKAEKSRRKYRIINIGIGAALIAYMLPGFIFPDLVIKYLVLFLGFGLLANGALRIIDGLKRQKQEHESLTFSSLGMGIIITAVAIAVLVFHS